MRHRILACLVTASITCITVASCSDPLFPGRPEAELSLLVQRLPASPAFAFPLTLHASVNGLEYKAVVDSVFGAQYVDIHVAHDGTLPVRLDLVDASGDTLGTNEYQQQFSSGSSNWVSGTVSVVPPLGSCIPRTENIPRVQLTDSVSLYIVYGSMAKGSIC